LCDKRVNQGLDQARHAVRPAKHNLTFVPVEDCLAWDYGLQRVDPMSAPSTSSAKVNRWASDRRFYAGVAFGTALITFIGFAQTYYLKVLFRTPPLRQLLHIHGLVMTAWFVLFFVQVRLIAVHRKDLHRRLGVAGAVLAGLALVLGAAVALSQGHLHLIQNDPAVDPPLVFLPVPLGVLLLFGIFVTAAILLRRRADYHKRLMVLACLSILLPSIDRLPFRFIEFAQQSTLFGINDLCVAICLVYDTFKGRRLHPVWVWGGALIVGLQILTLMLRHTPAWLRIAEWMLK
jgi:hypothetical protein